MKTAPNSQQQRISRSDMLLLLLYAEGQSKQKCEAIKGKTRLQKEVFLTQKKLRDVGIFTYYSFRPYKLGPYSKELYDDIELMSYEEVIEVRKIDLEDKGIYAEFRITEKGKKEIEKKMSGEKLDKAFEVATEIKKSYNSLDVVKLVRLTHELYPEYVGQ